MRGRVDDQRPLFHVFRVEDRIRRDHPPRDITRRADRLPAGMSAAFEEAYRTTGRPSAPPGRRPKALLLVALYSVRSDRPLCERGDTDLLSRGFLDRPPGDDAFDSTTLTRNRGRLDTHGPATAFFAAVVGEAVAAGLCRGHLTVGGPPTESWAALESVQPTEAGAAGSADGNGFQPRNPDVDLRGQKRTDETHRSRTDPEARPYRKGPGKEARLSHTGHARGGPARADPGRRGGRGDWRGRAGGGPGEGRRGDRRGGPATEHARGGRGARRRAVPPGPGGAAGRAPRPPGRGPAGPRPGGRGTSSDVPGWRPARG